MNSVPTSANKEFTGLLENLTNASGISGGENEVRKIVISQIKSRVDDYHIDTLGNILAKCKGKTKDALKVMLSAHMDEVGGMILEIDPNGFCRFDVLGNIDKRQLVGKSVLVGKSHIPGIIGTKPIHLTKPDEVKQSIPIENLRIDLGPDGVRKVKAGDRISFSTRFSVNEDVMLAKALDDRLGVAVLIDVIKDAPDNIDLLAAFTVQEEIGLRGARVAAYSLDPEIAIALDATNALEMPVWDDSENTFYNSKIGHGPVIYIADGSTINDPRLVRHAVSIAERIGIPYQFRQPGTGGTDAGAIHKSRAGIPSLTISIPIRNIHTPISIARNDDILNTVRLIKQMLISMDKSLLESERS